MHVRPLIHLLFVIATVTLWPVSSDGQASPERVPQPQPRISSPTEQATLFDAPGLAYETEGKDSEAMSQFREASAMLAGTPDADNFHLAEHLDRVGKAEMLKTNYATAEPLLKKAWLIWTQGPPWCALEAMASSDLLTELYVSEGQYTKAEEVSARGLEIARNTLMGRAVAEELDTLAAVYMQEGKYATSAKLYQQALDIWEKTPVQEHPETVIALTGLASDYGSEGQLKRAKKLVQEALRILQSSPEAASEEPTAAPNNMVALNNVGAVYAMRGKYSDAIQLLERVLAIESTTPGTGPLVFATTLSNLAVVYTHEKNYARAAPLLERSLAVMEAVLPQDSPKIGRILANLAEVHAQRHLYSSAESLCERSIAILEHASLGDYPQLVLALKVYAFTLSQTGKRAEAELFGTRAMVYEARYKQFRKD